MGEWPIGILCYKVESLFQPSCFQIGLVVRV